MAILVFASIYNFGRYLKNEIHKRGPPYESMLGISQLSSAATFAKNRA